VKAWTKKAQPIFENVNPITDNHSQHVCFYPENTGNSYTNIRKGTLFEVCDAHDVPVVDSALSSVDRLSLYWQNLGGWPTNPPFIISRVRSEPSPVILK
jgi:hypothetical protein